jgi:hypothetical protein
VQLNENDIQKVAGVGEVTEEQIRKAEKAISIWESVKPLFKTPGWQILINEVRKIHDKKDCLSNCSRKYEDFIYQTGEVEGLKTFLRIPETLQQNATSASKVLELGLAQDEE